MTLVIEDRVQETSTSTGTGPFSLAGASVGFRPFSDVCAIGDTFEYCIEAIDALGAPRGEWEIGTGTYSAVGVLTRTAITRSSNSDTTVSFLPGTKRIFLCPTAETLKLPMGDDRVGSDDGMSGAKWTTLKGFIAYLKSGAGASVIADDVANVGVSQYAQTRTALASASTLIPVCILSESGREGTFAWSASNLTAQVTADPRQGVYVAPVSDTTGASGAWVRKFGGPVNVKWFGAVGADVTVGIQAALDAHACIFLPPETFETTGPLYWNSYNFIVGSGYNSRIYANFNGAAFKGKAVTPASGTNVRVYAGGGRDFRILGPGRASGASIGLDMRGCSDFKFFNVAINEFDTLVHHGGGYSSYYNEYTSCDLSGGVYGYYNTALGNENKVFGGRVHDTTLGTFDSDCSHNVYDGVAVELFVTCAHKTGAVATQGITYTNSRVENAGGTGFIIDAASQDTMIVTPLIVSTVTTPFNDASSTTTIISPNYNVISGGTPFKSINRAAVVTDVPSIAAGAVIQQIFTVPGIQVGDSCSVALPSAWGSVMVGQPIVTAASTVYCNMHNPTGGAIDPASGTFVFTFVRGV